MRWIGRLSFRTFAILIGMLASPVRRLPVAAVLTVALLAGPGRMALVGAQSRTAEEAIAQAVDETTRAMSPEQRVGQLFLVSFDGASAGDGTGIAALVDDQAVGGVVLDPARDNFTNTPDAPAQVARLANELQARAARRGAPHVPLFIALPQLGDAFPDSPLYGGMTPLPSLMALGATWSVDHAEIIGARLGGELAAAGINLLLAPSVDVIAVPRSTTSGDLGVRAFGGSPAWVGQMARAYIAGVHRGSEGRVATVAGSFPGIGGADRSPADEFAVVEGAFEQLAAVELPPFVAITRPDGDGATDAIVTSHVRYRNIQQQADRPFSLDSGGLRYLLGQISELGAWRQPLDAPRAVGGVFVSAGLGQAVVRRYIDPEQVEFSPRRLVREALLAGNDVLVVTSFGPPGQVTDDRANIADAMDWLVGEYRADDAVRSRVDDAVRRILALKYRRFGGLPAEPLAVDADGAVGKTGLGGDEVAAVARDALTLISPADGAAVRSPQPGDQILFVVDARPVRECATCAARPSPDPEQVLGIVRRAYGPEGTGTARLRRNEDVAAITFRDLKLWLQATGNVRAEDTTALLERAPDDAPAREVAERIEAADWLVFAMRDVRPSEAPASDALRLFLKSEAAQAEGRRLVAFALGAPYHLDTTEIANLSAYYAVYARTAPFLETAVRALFGDVSPHSASPVSVPGISYDLADRLEPALDQRVSLEAVGWDGEQPIDLGGTFRMRTSPIHDTNGNVIADGTRITFRRYDRVDDVYLADVTAHTLAGRALVTLRAERPGEIEVTVARDNTLLSEPRVVRIVGDPSAVGGTPPGETDGPSALLRPRVAVDWGILFLSLSLVLLAGVLVYGADAEAARSPTRLVRLFLISVAWGLAGYLLVAAGGIQLGALPLGADLWPAGWNVAYQAPIASFVFGLLPVIPTLGRAVRRSRW